MNARDHTEHPSAIYIKGPSQMRLVRCSSFPEVSDVVRDELLLLLAIRWTLTPTDHRDRRILVFFYIYTEVQSKRDDDVLDR